MAALEHIGDILLSSGASSETTAMFCARVDSRGVGGVHGLEEEGEDILATVVPADEASERGHRGAIANGYAVIPLQWLALNRDDLRRRWVRR